MAIYSKRHLELDLAKADRASSLISERIVKGTLKGFDAQRLDGDLERFRRRCKMRWLKTTQLMGELRSAERAARANGLNPQQLPPSHMVSAGSPQACIIKWLRDIKQRLFWESQGVPELPVDAASEPTPDYEVMRKVVDENGKFVKWEPVESEVKLPASGVTDGNTSGNERPSCISG